MQSLIGKNQFRWLFAKDIKRRLFVMDLMSTAICLFAAATVHAQLNQSNVAKTYPLQEDVASIDGLMSAYYYVVSGPANTHRNLGYREYS